MAVLAPQTGLTHDLVLVAPEQAAPGTRLPLRALLYAGLSRIEGPVLASAQTTVELRDARGLTLTKTTLTLGHGPSLEGAITLPEGARGTLQLRGSALLGDGGREITVERTLEVGPGPPQPISPRPLRPLAQLAHGPLRGPARETDGAGEPLTAQVAGGACTPELPCTVLVHVGGDGWTLAATSTPSATVEALQPSGPARVAVLRVRTHGPESLLELRALDAKGEVVAERGLRLPVALGTTALRVPSAVLPASARPHIELLGEPTAGVVDLFADGRWLHTQSVPAHDAPVALAFESLPSGLYRAQARSDAFESEGPSVASFYVRAEHEPDASVLRALASHLRDRGRAQDAELDAIAQVVLATADEQALAVLPFDATSRYFLAALDAGVMRLPAPVSGYPLARKQALAARQDVRLFALVVLVLAGSSLVLLLVLRGLRGSEEAHLLLHALGTDDARLSRERTRMIVRVVLAALSIVLAFSAIALYLIVRGRAS